MDTTGIKERFMRLKPFLNERQRRLAAAAEAQSLGRGGVGDRRNATGFALQPPPPGVADVRSETVSGAQNVL